ncbi:MAG: J domain-containing protein, partial [Kangiella sp.]|nr:J domain-containing protein [Kangiella sp.]
LDQLRIMGIPQRDVIISTDLRLRQDGLPYSNQKQPDDVGVSVWFMQDGQQKVIALDKYNRISDNLWAVAKTIEAMRGIDRWGGGQILERVFTGFNALPSPDSGSPLNWKDYFSSHGFIIASRPKLKEAYKVMARRLHPDRGGDASEMATLNKMYEQGKEAMTNA